MKKLLSIIMLTATMLTSFYCKGQTFFSSVSPSGHTLYYHIVNTTSVEVVNKGSYDSGQLAYYTFQDSTVIGNVIIPSNVTYNGTNYIVTKIAFGAFFEHIGITGVAIPNTVTDIGDHVFGGCRNLISITIPSSVTIISGSAFSRCNGVTSINVQNGNAVYDSRDNCNALIKTAENRLLKGCSTTVIPATIESIAGSAFNGCYGLTSITIPSCVHDIGFGAFCGCKNLTSINVQEGNLFYDSRGNCNAIIQTADNDLIVGCQNTIVPSTVRKIGAWAFFGQTELQSMLMSDSITHIGYGAFSYCTQLSTITIPPSVVLIDDCAFLECLGLDTIQMLPMVAPRVYSFSFDSTVYISLPCGADCSYYNNNLGWGCYQANIHEPEPDFIVSTTENYPNRGYSSIVQQRGNNVSCDSSCVILATPNDGYRFVRWSNGNTANPDTLHLYSDTVISAIFSDVPDPELCMVSVEEGHNILQWNRTEPCAAYRLYRESVVAGDYEQIAEIPYNSTTLYIDSISRPQTRSYRYRISAVDSDGVEGYLSSIHKTMHLTINQGLGGRWNLSWTPYEGADYTTYIIYRGTNAYDLQQIDIMPADGNTSYTDETAPEGDVYYQVGIVMSTPCSGAADLALGSKSTNISLSNIATNSTIGIDDIADIDGIKVFSENNCIIINGLLGQNVAVYTIDGKTIASLSQALESVAIPVPIEGVYIVKVGNFPARKIGLWTLREAHSLK